MIRNNNRERCSCCGYYTLEPFYQEQRVCLVCYWQDDAAQNANPELEAKPNYINLNNAKKKFSQIKAIAEEYLI